MNLIPVNNERDRQLQLIELIKDNYSAQCKSWLKWIREKDKQVSDIREYFQYLKTSNYKARTIANKRAAVKKRVRQLFKEAGTDVKMRLEAELKEIDQEIKPPKINSDQVETDKVLTKQDYKALLNKCRTDRQKAFIMFLFSTGCRINELTGIELSDCENMGDYIKITVMGKGDKERKVRIDSELFHYLEQVFQGKKYLFETSTGKRYLNDYISKQISKQGRKIDRHISAHSLRHSFATNMINAYPAQIQAVSKYMGHHDVSITLNMYVHNQLSNDELFSLIH